MRKEPLRTNIPLDIINAAVAGDEDATVRILRRYDAKITAGCMYEVVDENGRHVRRLDEDMKSYVQITLIRAIRKWRKMI